MSTSPTSTTDQKVVVHLHVREADRSRLRAIAALHGVGVSDLVAGWAVEQAARLGLPDIAAVTPDAVPGEVTDE